MLFDRILSAAMKNYYFWTIIVWVFIVELYSVLPYRIPTSEINNRSQLPSKYFSDPEIAQGIIHVHSTFSDGGGAPDVIAKEAAKAGMDFVILTDHNNYEARKSGFEKQYGRTDLFVEMESATPAGHVISFFSESATLKNSDYEAIIQSSYKQVVKKEFYPGLFVSIAHPTNIKNPWGRLDKLADGLEVINFDSSWQRQALESPFQFLLTILIYPFNQSLSAMRFYDPFLKDFTAWDEMTAGGPGHFAYLAHDTHSKIKIDSERSLSWPGYFRTFKMASNVLFLKEPKALDFVTRKHQYYQSLRAGRLAIVYHSLFPFQGNSWVTQCGDTPFISGDVVTTGGSCEMVIRTPITPFSKIIRLIKNGEITNEVSIEGNATAPLKLPLSGNGTYRVEVLAKVHTALRVTLNRLVPYVLYSPVYVQ